MRIFTTAFLMLLLPLMGSAQIVWDNFENTRIGYYDFVHGGMTTRYANPAPDDVNGSELCAQYVRNPGEMWDVIVLVSNGPFNSLTDYVNGTKTMSVDVFSPAIGIPVQITLEDSAVAGATNYPAGRHSIYTSTTTVENAWETIEFTFDSQPDATVVDENVTSIILLFDPGSNTDGTYYFDNVVGPEFENQCDGVVLDPANNLQDWDCNWNMRFCPSNSPCDAYGYMSGWLNHAYNPDMTGINDSKYCGEYTRNPDGAGEDILISYFDGPLNLSVNQFFNFKAYGPPRPLILSFQNANNDEIYVWNGALTAVNEWQQFSIDLGDYADAGIDHMVVLLDQGVVNWDLYYLDDFQLTLTPISVDEISEMKDVVVYPQPARDEIAISTQIAGVLDVTIFNLQGQIAKSVELQNGRIDVSDLEVGAYVLQVKSEDSIHTQQIQIIR